MDSEGKAIIKQCLEAVVNGPFIPSWEFSTLFGIERDQVAMVLANWPNVDENDDTVRLAINNSLNNLMSYPIDSEHRWSEFISVSRSELERVLAEWRLNSGLESGAYFDNMR